ncbi:MAG: prepilin-type N-terminal cleavage/methylation domain-containing protein [Candidatus Sulfotelmatobacter sp.]
MRVGKTNTGFTLVELMVSMAVGLTVIFAMASLFKSGMASTFIVAQRVETQQNMRAAMQIMVKDINLAGAGLPTGGLQLPLGGGGGKSRYGCDQTGTCYVPAFTYPANYMNGINPGFSNGVQGGVVVPSAPGLINDSITVVYCDYNFPLFEYNGTFPDTTGKSIGIVANPSYVPAPPLITAAGGIQVGDLILMSNTGGSAVGEVTALTPTALTFSDLDPLNINQSGATSNNIATLAKASPTASVYRLFAVTYYLTVPVNGQLPRLMRQVNGLTPVPVADNIINLQFTYDDYNTNTSALDPNQANPIGVGDAINMIQKTNVVIYGQSLTLNGNQSQNMYLATSVSARNMAFRNRYQ